MKRKSNFLAGLAMAMLAVTGFAQDPNIINHPGFVNLDEIPVPPDAAEVTEVDIGPELLGGMASMFSGEKHAEIGKELEGFLSIRVKTFNIDSMMTLKLRPVMEKMEQKLNRENWKNIVRVRKGREMTNVSVKYDKRHKRPMGLFIMSVEPGSEASFVNIVGSVDLGKLSQMGIDMNPNTLDSLKDAMEQ
ncbi:DUF4252 domain-containing protein [bacterium]|nr:DUF4252 domain-containing protein [bacterium]